MAPKRSIFRGPEAQHFQLVHRSQRDPLIHDPEASQRVLKPVERGNDRDKQTGYTLSDLDAAIDKSSMRPNEGEAAMYGITFDDSSYDYMAHLRPVQGGFDSVLVPGPKSSGVAKGMKSDRKGKGKELFVPDEVLASEREVSLDVVYGQQEGIPRELQGLQPDMDPHLRQVLEALEDDAFVEDEEEGDDGVEWWGELIKGGEAEDDQREDYEFDEWGAEESKDREQGEDRPETWEDRFKAFKQGQTASASEDEVERSEMADTIGSLASNLGDMMVKGGKKRRGKRGPSDASGMSMSSSSLFRTEGLRDLDDRFDQVERAYEIEDDEEWSDDDGASSAPSNVSGISNVSRMSRASLFSSTSTSVPEVSREDFDSILDDFLDNYEVVGRRMRPALGGTGLTGLEKLQVLRSAVDGGGEEKEENRRRVLKVERENRGVRAKREQRVTVNEKDVDKWDVETILTTYTNTENHPAVIRARTVEQARRRAEQMATVPAPRDQSGPALSDEDEDDSGSDTERETPKITVARPKDETTDNRRARKAAVKAERSARRAEKKSHTASFGDERKRQLASHKKMVGGGRAADVAVGSRGVVSLS